MTHVIPIKGRGTSDNPKNRFEGFSVEGLDDVEQPGRPKTQFFRDTSKSILAENNSPDLGFKFSLNPYRGCEHGCIYCYARPTHEYLGLSAGLDFETKIFVKDRAPELLRQEFARAKWKPQSVALSGNTDCYQPVEKKLELTRRCLEVFLEFRNPVFIITKNHLVTRDIDLLKGLAEHNAISVHVSVTTLDQGLCAKLEPRTSAPERRLEAIEKLARAGIPVGVNVAPVIPGLTDHEMSSIMKAAKEAGASCAMFTAVRLPYAVSDLFERWLADHFPDRKDKVLNRIRELRGGKLNDPRFGSRMKGEGIFAEQMKKLFQLGVKKLGFSNYPELSTKSFRRPVQPGEQITLF